MSINKLFNSKTKPIPRIRPDLDIIPMQNNGDSYLYFHDLRGYAPPDFALDQSAQTILSLFDGHRSISDLKSYLGNGTTTDQLLEYVQFLDENRLLHSSHFVHHAEQIELTYEQSTVHQSITAGRSYPANPDELQNFLDDAFARYADDSQITNNKFIKALYAPHIDPRVGMKTYVESFQALTAAKPKRVIILATSHYSGLYPEIYKNKPFVISDKNFEMPMGTIPADREAIDLFLDKNGKMGVSTHDRAHRIEHSIELHLLFLQYIWQHKFSIIPIVVGGFDELFYMEESHLEHQLTNFSELLCKQFGHDEETLFLISGDLAHIGKKFGDQQAANSLNGKVEQFDKQFLEAGETNSTDHMLNLMKQNYDPYRICGFPPLYTFLKAFPDLKGQIISYDRWDETVRESAVTFGSILYQ